MAFSYKTFCTFGIHKTAWNTHHRRLLHLGKYFNRGSLSEIELQEPVQLAGRKFLASSGSPDFPKFLSGPREDYPLLVKAKNGKEAGLLEWAKRARQVIDSAFEGFEKDGTAVAILFRGLPLETIKDYSTWVNALGFEPFKYVGGVTARNEIDFNVAEGALDPCEITVEPHTEMAYSPLFPKIFSIFCLEKASWGGETAIVDIRQTLASLDPEFVGKCAQKGIRYTYYLPDKRNPEVFYKSWQDQFFTEDPKEVVGILKEQKYSFEWRNGNLFYYRNRPALMPDPRNGELLWFNSATTNHHSYFVESPYLNRKTLPKDEYVMNTMLGNGEDFTPEEIGHLRSTIWSNAVGFNWQNGDVLFIDQLIVQHSRLSYQGDRKVGISLLTY